MKYAHIYVNPIYIREREFPKAVARSAELGNTAESTNASRMCTKVYRYLEPIYTWIVSSALYPPTALVACGINETPPSSTEQNEEQRK